MQLKNVILLIEEYNEGEDREAAIRHIEDLGLNCKTDIEDIKALDIMESFVYTDSRELADLVKKEGFGFALYYNDKSRYSIFSDSLYSVEAISSLSDKVMNRMLLRYLNIPWVIFETKRCIVREIKEDDVAALYRIFRDSPEIEDEDLKFDESLYEDPLREEAYIRDYIKYQYRFFEYGIWLVIDKDTKEIIGRAGLSSREGYEDLELGYVIAPHERNKGYGYEVIKGVMDYAFSYMKLKSLNAFVRPENKKSIRLLERSGLKYEKEADIDGAKYLIFRIDSDDQRRNIKEKMEEVSYSLRI